VSPRRGPGRETVGTLVGLLAAAAALGPVPAPADIAGCPVFPADHALNMRVDHLAVHPLSAAYISSIGPGRALHPDFGTFYQGAPIGFPMLPPGAFAPVTVNFQAYGSESDPGPYRIPLNAPIEGGSTSTGDRHVLTVDQPSCVLYELYRAFPQTSSWDADSGAIYDLNDYALRPDTFTSADAAGLPIFPLLVRKDEADAGAIRHAIRFTARFTHGPHVWPARHDADTTSNPLAPPMGQRFRLKAATDLSGFTPRVQAIFQAFKTYGLVLADNGSDWFVSGVHDPSWSDDELVTAFGQLHGSDFEAVDTSGLVLDPSSARAALVVLSSAVNQPAFMPGTSISVTIGAVNPGTPNVADFYAGVLLPDHDTVLFFTESGGFATGHVSDLASFRPVATGVSLATPFAATVPGFFRHTWAGTEPAGGYLFFFAALRPGPIGAANLIGAATAFFTVGP
jgi:hypothetical protein